MIGLKARFAALALALSRCSPSLLFHAFWALPADQQFVQQLMFMKNLSIAGGLFIVAALGADRLAVDARMARA